MQAMRGGRTSERANSAGLKRTREGGQRLLTRPVTAAPGVEGVTARGGTRVQ